MIYIEYCEECGFETRHSRTGICKICQRMAWKKLEYAIRKGRIEKKTECEICGSTTRIQGHHDDYHKPYEVRWMCYRCHKEHHYGKQESIDYSTRGVA